MKTEFEPVVSLVNGGLVKDLLDLCNEQFIDYFFQEYAGANFQCLYCGALRPRNGTVFHHENCASLKYIEICKKHGNIVKIKGDK